MANTAENRADGLEPVPPSDLGGAEWEWAPPVRHAGQIARSGVLLGMLSLLAQFVGLVREGTISYFLGATGRADAYVAAYQPVDALANALLLSIPFAVIPFMLIYRKEYGGGTAIWALSRTQMAAVLATLTVCVALFFGSRWVIYLSDPALSGAQAELSVQLWRFMLPSVVLASITAFYLAELIADHRFLCQGLNPILLNLSIVLLGVLGWRFFGVYSLAAGVLLGFTSQTVIQTVAVLRRRRLFWTAPRPAPPVFRRAFAMMGPVFLLYFLGALNQLIPRRFAAQFGAGSLAIFAYAMRAWIPVFMLGVLTISYPYFSSFAAAVTDDAERACRLFRSMLRSCFLFALPAMAAVTILRADIVRVLFSRGAFDAHAASSVSSTIAYLAPFLAGALVSDLLSRCLVAFRRPLLACAIYMTMLALIWIVSSRLMAYGMRAIALGWGACFYAGAVGFFIALSRQLPGIKRDLAGSLMKIVAASLVAGAAMFLVAQHVNFGPQSSLLRSVLRILATLFSGLLAMGGTSYLLGISEARVLIERRVLNP